MGWSFIDYSFALLHLLGAIIILSGLFLYEDEEGQFQNKLQEWWIKIDDQGKASRSKVATFMQEVAKLAGCGFDRLLGENLLSVRFVFCSICLSIASIFLFGFLLIPHVSNPHAKVPAGNAFVWFLIFVAFALVPAFDGNNKWVRSSWWAVIIANLYSLVRVLLHVSRARGGVATIRGVLYLVLAFAFSLLCDLLYIMITRWLLRRISMIDRIYEIVLGLLVNLLLLELLIWLPVFVGARMASYSPMAGGSLAISFVLNSFDVIAGSAALLIGLLMLLHRLIWPLVERPLYALYRYAPLKNKIWLWGTGITLLVLPMHMTIELIRSILEKL